MTRDKKDFQRKIAVIFIWKKYFFTLNYRIYFCIIIRTYEKQIDTMNISLLQIASIIAIFQAILMGFFFLQNKKSPRTGNYIFSSMLFAFSLISACSLLLTFDGIKFNATYPKYIFIVSNFSFLIGPLLFFYIQSLLQDSFSFKAGYWIHFIPFVIAIGYSIILMQQQERFLIWQYPKRIYFGGAILIQNLLYFIFSLEILHSNGLSLKTFLSYISDLKLAWVRFFISGFIVLWLVQLQLFVGWDVLQNPSWCPYATSLYLLIAFVFFNGIIYIALKKPETFSQGQKYQHSVLKKSDKEQYIEKLMILINQDRVFLKPSISLIEIAKRLDIAPCYISQIINETFQQNFRDFINKYRIEESKRLLAQPNQQFNILGIAQEAGFNSKSAFNSAFKRHSGITPKEFKKKAAVQL
jgi:AraC-like DNA-binding protein